MDRYKKLGAFVGAGLVVLFWVVTPAMAQTSPNLGTAGPYAVLGANVTPTSGTVTCSDTGPGTAINGDVGTTPSTPSPTPDARSTELSSRRSPRQ